MAIVTGDVPIPEPSSLAVSDLGVGEGFFLVSGLSLLLPLPVEEGGGGSALLVMGALVGWGGTTDPVFDSLCTVVIGRGTGVLKIEETTGTFLVDDLTAALDPLLRADVLTNSGARRSSSVVRI